MEINILSRSSEYLKLIFMAGRGCYGAEYRDTSAESDAAKMSAFAKKLISAGHESVLEHVSVSISIIDVSRSFLAQITRHRMASYSIKSQHFVNHSNFRYRTPDLPDSMIQEYKKLMDDINKFYKKAILRGAKVYNAREALPNSAYTNMVMTANIREWRLIIRTRITDNNTPEISAFARLLLRTLYLEMPEIFADLRDDFLEGGE